MVSPIAVRAEPPAPAGPQSGGEPGNHGAAHRSTGRSRTAVALVVTALAIALGGYAVRDQVPSPGAVVDLLAGAEPFWLGVALVAAAASVLAVAMVQRRLVTDLGGILGVARSVELTLTSGAISMALPAGSAVGAGYTYRRLRRTGLSSADAGVSMVGSAGLLAAALAVLYLAVTGPGLITDLASAIGANAVTALLLLVVALVVLALRSAQRSAGSRDPQLPAAPVQATVAAAPSAGRIPRLVAAVPAALRLVRRYLRAVRVTAAALPRSTWRSGAGWAVAKWTADFAVLAGAVLAVGANADLLALASIYVAVQVLRQAPITPGGVGVIEAALLAGLLAAGVAAAPAAAAVVIYRGVTYWLALATGAAVALLFRAPAQTAADVPARPLTAVGGSTA